MPANFRLPTVRLWIVSHADHHQHCTGAAKAATLAQCLLTNLRQATHSFDCVVVQSEALPSKCAVNSRAGMCRCLGEVECYICNLTSRLRSMVGRQSCGALRIPVQELLICVREHSGQTSKWYDSPDLTAVLSIRNRISKRKSWPFNLRAATMVLLLKKSQTKSLPHRPHFAQLLSSCRCTVHGLRRTKPPRMYRTLLSHSLSYSPKFT